MPSRAWIGQWETPLTRSNGVRAWRPGVGPAQGGIDQSTFLAMALLVLVLVLRARASRDQGRTRRRRPRPPTNRSRTATSGVHPLATEPRPRRAATAWRRCRETSDWWTVSRSPARRSTSHASNTRCSSGCPSRATLVSASVNSKDLCDERCRPGPEQLARLTIPTCVQDRLRFSEALRLGDNSHRNRAAVIHKLPQHRLGVGPLLDRHPWAHEHRWTATRPRPNGKAIGGKA
jgi:hypothetical protein